MKKILIVDDQPELRQLVALSLGEDAYHIYYAENGESALEQARAEQPDLVILDLMMPGTPDGFGVCWELKADPELQHSKVLILSGRPADESSEACEQFGADGFIAKPFSPMGLAARVEDLLHDGRAEPASGRKRVLIVDDRPELRRLINIALGSGEYEVEEAVDGESALEAVRRLKPHLMVLDLMMPGALNGYDVCWAVKSDENLAHTRVLMLTARGEEQDRIAGESVGADAYFVKPFSPLELLRRVDRLLASA